jgi:hypothetical protein
MLATTTRARRTAAVLAALSLAVALLAAFIAARPAQAANHDNGDKPQFTVTLVPDHGPVGSTFRATLTVTGMTCRPDDVAFYLSGAVRTGMELAPVVTMPQSCRATATIKAPSAWSAGDRERIYGTYPAPYMPPYEHGATFKVDVAASHPTASPSRARQASPTRKPKPEQGTKTPSATPSPSAVATASPQPSLDISMPVRHAATVGPDSSQVSDALLITAVTGIVMVGLFGGWAAYRQGRMASRNRGGD